MFYLTKPSTHFIYDYMASDIWLRTTMIIREEIRFMGYSFRLAARNALHTPSYRQDITYHGFWYTSFGAQAGTRNSLMGPPGGIDPTTYRTISYPVKLNHVSNLMTITNCE